MQIVNELVGINVRFGGGVVLPIGFDWRGRYYVVQRVTMTFERKNGGRRYLCFIAETAGMLAELAMDRESLIWRLGKCEPSCT
jgi:hypothetical protein